YFLFGQLLKITGHDPLRAGRVAANPDLGQVGHQHLEADDAVADPLFGDLDRRNVAGIAQDGACPGADFAHDGDWHVAPDIGRIGRGELFPSEALEPFELNAA